MVSGGSRARSGPAPDPLSRTSLVKGREFILLPRDVVVEVPKFPFAKPSVVERRLWREVWAKPQAVMWERLGLVHQVAAYVRAFVESVEAEASAGLKTAVLRMETELGISTSGMLQNGWKIADDSDVETTAPSGGVQGKRQTSTGSWLAGVKVEKRSS